METLSGVMSIFQMLIWNISIHVDDSYMSVYVCQNFSVCILNTWAHYFLNYTSIKNLATWGEELTHRKRPWCWERLKAGGEGTTEDEMVWWHHWLNGQEFEQAAGVGDRQGSLACCRPLGHKEWGHDWATELNWELVENI